MRMLIHNIKISIFLCFIYSTFLELNIFAQTSAKIVISWKPSIIYTTNNNLKLNIPDCESCVQSNNLPYLIEKINSDLGNSTAEVKVLNYQTVNLSPLEATYVSGRDFPISTIPNFSISNSVYQGKSTVYLEGFPFVKENGTVKKISSFTYSLKKKPLPFKAKSFVAHSVLSNPTDKWYKMAINKDGIYKIDKSFLSSMGVNVNGLNPKNINIYGNATGRLPVSNADYRPDDLVKNSIFVFGESDNSFDDGDYILFHAYGPSKWSYSSNLYRRDLNPYTTNSYYYIRISSTEPALRINSLTPSGIANAIITTYDYSLIHEQDLRNLVDGGQRYYGEEFDAQLSQTFNFSVPDYVADPASVIFSYAYINEFSGSNIDFYLNNSLLQSNLLSTNPQGDEPNYARREDMLTFTPNSSNLSLKVVVNRNNPSVITYLDKIELFVKRQLKMVGDAFYFRTNKNVGFGNSNEYFVSNFPSDAQVWDLTNRTKPIRINGTLSGSQYSFVVPSDTIHEFVAFKPSGFMTPTYIGEVAPQDLHGMPFADILIVTNPIFLSHANRLADLHRNIGESVNVATTEQIYNEFSSGQKDPVAIRFFAKMFYDRAGGDMFKKPKNLILFGAGNYDPRGIKLTGDYVPMYEDPSGENLMAAFTSDDFFTILDDAESFHYSNAMDIGVGRMIAKNEEEAEILLSKTKSYLENSYHSNPNYGDWRLKYILIADDEDTFVLSNQEPFSDSISLKYPEMNAIKIYADAYPQQITVGGIRFPEMVNDINENINKGSLFVNYVGHGGTKGAGDERFINREQILNWNNIDKLHLFVSATCDFTRIDDPGEVSAGESDLLSNNGGAVALMTTNRAILYSTNNDIVKNLHKNILYKDSQQKALTFGEILQRTKNGATQSGDNKRSFMVIGDPALRLAYPRYKVITDSLNGLSINDVNLDTLKALTKITIKGHLEDNSGNLMSSYNGILSPSVYDKPKNNKTLGHLPGTGNQKANIIDFKTQTNTLFKGNVTVKNGNFTFSFIVPKDIDYQYGKGKISYYSTNNIIDAGGYSNVITIGGLNPNGIQDKEPPIIKAYMNDEHFVNNGLTDEHPKLIIKLSDNYGINAVGNGIGHDITLVLDENEANPIIANDYFIYDLDSYKTGSLTYPFKDLAIGPHTLKIKVWDVNNNSSEFKLDFLVSEKKDLSISHVLNYPNPFTTSTDFYFEHNQFNEQLETQIRIYTVSGKLVKTINKLVTTSGFRSEGIHWDGRDDFGDQLARGVYVYILSVKDSSGNKVQKLEKLVLLK